MNKQLSLALAILVASNICYADNSSPKNNNTYSTADSFHDAFALPWNISVGNLIPRLRIKHKLPGLDQSVSNANYVVRKTHAGPITDGLVDNVTPDNFPNALKAPIGELGKQSIEKSYSSFYNDVLGGNQYLPDNEIKTITDQAIEIRDKKNAVINYALNPAIGITNNKDTLEIVGQGAVDLYKLGTAFFSSSQVQKTNNTRTLNMTTNVLQNSTSHFGIPHINRTTDRQDRPTVQENPFLTKGSIPLQVPVDIVLRWGDRPADLDAHLTGPTNNSSERFHIHFENKGSLTGSPNAMLYRDDTSHGADTNRPEQMRIDTTRPGRYDFYVHDFSNKGSQNSKALSQSGATVTLYSAGNRNLPEGNNLGKQVGQPIPVPKDKVGTVWHSFELDTRRNTLTPKDTMSNDRNIIK